MIPIGNEPHGFAENQESHTTHIGNGNSAKKKDNDVQIQNNIAGNATGNLSDEEDLSHNEIVNENPEGFLGDFAEPQHDDE